jgi:hypothetical protein
MSFFEVMQRLSAALNGAGIPYMLTGSFASVFYGCPRSTQDIDIVIDATSKQLQQLIEGLPKNEYYAEADEAVEALNKESMFNVIDQRAGWKIDLIIRKSRDFSRGEFNRRTRRTVQGLSLYIASAEDVILSKLEWAKLGKSQRQIEDAAGILKIRADELDRTYVERWVRELGLAEQWKNAQNLTER